MYIKPQHDKILVQADSVSGEKKVGSLILPDIRTERPNTGTVIESSIGYFDNGTWVRSPFNSGDRVLYGKYSAVDVEFDGKTYVFIRFSDVLAIIEDDEGPETGVPF